MRHLSAIALCFALALPASAQEPPAGPAETSAEEHSRRGVAFYADGKLPEAVREMLKAYELAPESGLLYNIARIYQKMGQRDLAIHYLKEFVTQPGADPDTVQKALGHLEGLERAQAPTVKPLAEPARAPETPQPAPAPVPVPVEAESADNTLAWITLGAGGAALVVGGVLGGMALSSAGDLEDAKLGYEDKLAAQQSARDLALGADISIGVGVASAALGLVLFLISGDDEAEAAAVFVPDLGQGRAGGLLTVRFP